MSIRPLSNYGERLAEVADPNAVGIQVVANPTAKQSVPPIEIDRFCRNGQHPNATFQNQVNTAANAAVLYRSKQVFAMGDTLADLPSDPTITSFGVGDRSRYRFAFHTGPYTHALYCIVVVTPQDAGFTSNAYARLDLATNVAGTPAVLSQTFSFGNHPTNGSISGGWPYMKVIMNFVDGVAADTDYYATFYDVDYCRISSVCVFDLQSMTEHVGGYLSQSTTTHTPVVGLQRQLPVDINNALWQVGGAQVLNFSVNNGTAPVTTTSTTATNIIDGTSTAISAATPGYTLDMTGKDRINQTSGVPCIMKAFLKGPGAGVAANVYLKDSGGSTIATCTTTSSTGVWVSSGSFNLPATEAKYDLMYSSGSGGSTASVYAVSVYEKG